jgi:prepilin-type N-terminal cleavage/methylation domain-containing protein
VRRPRLTRLQVRRVVGDERGYSLVEVLTVLVIMGIVMGGLTTLFVQGSNAELDMNRRFQAQLTARLALDKLRREVHCASVATPTGSASSITITLPSYCKTGSGSVTWCTRSSGTSTYALYRIVGSSCTGGVKWADFLVASPTAPTCSGALCIFNYTAQTASSLAKLHVELPINVKPSRTVDTYDLADDLVLRNSTRS